MRGRAPQRRKRMELREIVEHAKEELAAITTLKVSGVVGASRQDDGWHVGVELVERKSIPDTQDLLGVYEVILDDEGRILTYERKRVRRRMDVETSVS